MNKITCITRSMNDNLYNMMLDLCDKDWKFIKVKNSSASGYLDFLFNTDFGTKWILNLDEDCFLTNPNKIYSLIEYLEKNSYDYSGIQDGGSIPVRIHNPLVANPFFNLFNSEKIHSLPKEYPNKNSIDLEKYKEKYKHLVRFIETEYKYDLFEEFYFQFFWLLDNGLLPYYQRASAFDKERYLVVAPLGRIIPYYNSPTMIYDHNDEELAIHTWHSRFFHYPNIKKRIVNCYNYAKATNNSKVNRDDLDISVVKLNR